MLYHLLAPLTELHIVFNLFSYITFRSAGAMFTGLVFSLAAGPIVIRWLKTLRVGQVVRDDGPENHLSKAGTPTMGGLLILIGTVLSTLLWARLDNVYVILALVVLVWMGALGFMDDYLKVVKGHSVGLVARYKLIGQGLLGALLGAFLILYPVHPVPANWTGIPFVSDYNLVIWLPLFIPWVILVLAGSSNAVNLTDGLDGLAAGLTTLVAGVFGVFAYLIGRIDTSAYLGLFYLPGAGELAVFCVALAGAALGFLWYNAHPAEVFMGDTGSLALGGAIGGVALLLKSELVLVIVGGVFVLEAISVILQVGWFKYTARRYGRGQRIFKMAPLHHHYEKTWDSESKVIIRFWILGIIFALMAFGTLKIR